MKNVLFLLGLSMLPLCACEGLTTREEYEAQKQKVNSYGLQNFLRDYETWSQEDKAKVTIVNSNIIIGNLPNKHEPYGISISFFIANRTQDPKEKEMFIGCLRYLQEK